MLVKIVENITWGAGKGFITLDAPHFFGSFRPGQMCMLSVVSQGSTDPLLRRTFSPYSVKGNLVSILYAVVGRGTRQLSQRAAGDTLNLSKPSGKPFTPVNNKKVALIAGGVGIGPVNSMAEYLLTTGCDVTVFYGGRTKADLYPPLLLSAPYRLITATEDGSHGIKGFITEALKNTDGDFDMCYTCGPAPMMKAVYGVCLGRGWPLEVSTEEVMACGIGVCGGCLVDVKEGDSIVKKRCCTEGPVFKAELIY